MIDTINCTNCGSEIKSNIAKCNCGYSMSVAERNDIINLIRNAESIILIDENIGIKARSVYKELEGFELDKKYYRSKSAKNDFSKKNKFIRNKLIPEINNWHKKVTQAEQQIANEKLEVYGRMYQITDFIINEFFGRFKIKEDNLEFFLEIRDYSKYEIAETMITSNLDFSDIETTDLGAIGMNMLSSGFNALENGSFTELAKKSEWSKSDRNRVAAEVGIAMGAEIINGIGNLLIQNSEKIKNIREANLKLNKEMSRIGGVMSGLSIEERELKKLKRLYDRCDLVIDITYKYKLLPIVIEYINNPLYLDYKTKRKPYDLGQEKIQINETVLNEPISLSFWGSLLTGKKSNFAKAWNKRLKSTDLESKYNQINLELKESSHKTLNELFDYESIKTERFREFEKSHRKLIRREDIWKDNYEKVQDYAAIFKNIKKHITAN